MYILLQFYDLLTKKVVKYALLIVVLILIPGTVYSFQLTLAWDANYEPDLAGYTVHYGAVSRNYEFSVDVGKYESVVISGLEMGKTYYFAVTAYDSDQNESDFSTELSYKVHGLKSSSWIPLLLLDD